MRFLPGVVFTGMAAVFALSGCRAESKPVESISLDFPNGETRLLVERDGAARLFYGELPQSLTVLSGVFDINDLSEKLQSRLRDVVFSEARPAGQPFGMVNFHFSDGSSKDYYIYDGAFAEELFVSACRNVSTGEGNSSQLFEMVCGKRIGE